MKNNNTLLITGGAGYIGSHVCKEAMKAGYKVVAFDNLSNSYAKNTKYGKFERGDIRDSKRIEEIILKYKPIAIIHLAASTSVGESTINPYEYYSNNVYGTLEILHAMVKCEVKYMVFSSSAAVYGIPTKAAIKESDKKDPINPYGKTKLICEKILKDFSYAHNIKYVALRYFNVAGFDVDDKVKCKTKKVINLIPIIMKKIKENTLELSVFGNDYNTLDGTCIRDYIHVNDVAKANILSLKFLLKTGGSTEFNIGTGIGNSVSKIVKITEQTTHKTLKINYMKRRDGDPNILVADISKAQKILNWKPVHSSLKEIVKTSYNRLA